MMDCQKMDLIESLHTKGHFSKIRNVRKGSNLGNLLLFGNFLKNGPITFLYCFACSFLGMILINCQEMGLIKLLER